MSLLCRINELDREEGNKVSLVGVVVEFSFFKETQGTDFMTVLKIVDNSGDNSNCGRSKELSVNVFASNTNQLPRIKSFGDIIVFHKVLIKKHNNELFAIFNKKYSEFGLLNEENNNFVQYQSSELFVLRWNEQNFIANLKTWWHQSEQNFERTQYLLPMKSISMNNYFDLVCKVLHVCYDTTNDIWIAYVWDGTDVPPLSLDGSLPNEQITYVPLQIESTPLEITVIRRLERLGTVLRVITTYGLEYFTNFPGIGKWVVLRNMQCSSFGGMWYGVLNANSRVRLLANTDRIVESCESDYRRRELEQGRLPLFYSSNILTGVGDRELQFSTLMDVVASEQDEEFVCVIRLVALSQIDVEIHSILSDVDLNRQTFELTLEDATTRIQAILRACDMVAFFEYQDGDIFKDNVKRLLGVSEHADLSDPTSIIRFPLWIECYIIKEIDEEGKRCYFVCRS